MKHDVEGRLAALEEALELRRLAELDEQGKTELLQSLNEDGLNLSPDAFEQFIADYRKE